MSYGLLSVIKGENTSTGFDQVPACELKLKVDLKLCALREKASIDRGTHESP